MKQLMIEAVVVGILSVVVGKLVIYLFFNSQTSNKNESIEITLFLTGVFIHFICEYTGVNKWYCKNGNACKN